MTDCISRQAAIDAINEREWLTQDAKEILAEVIEKLPSEDAIEVVRCKDCKFWGARGLCQIWDEYISNESFYCGCAERRTDE